MKTNANTLKATLGLALLAALAVPPAQATALSGQGTWETTLQGRDLDGNTATFEAYYDTSLNITWLADANYAKTSGYDADGRMTWGEAMTWANQLAVGGYSDWRLPAMLDTWTPGCNYSETGGTDCGHNVQTRDANTGTVYSEMAHLYYITLANKDIYVPGTGAFPQPGWGLSNTGPFSNIGVGYHVYWSGLEYAPDTNNAWGFGTAAGGQGEGQKTNQFSGWAVRQGDVAVTTTVPEPQTYALALAGLATALIATSQRLSQTPKMQHRAPI